MNTCYLSDIAGWGLCHTDDLITDCTERWVTCHVYFLREKWAFYSKLSGWV